MKLIRTLLFAGICGFLTLPAVAADDLSLSFYLPAGVEYEAAIPTPSSSLGWEVGTWHVRHDQLVQYLRELAAASDRVQLIETGRTYQDRQLIQLHISAPKNLERLEELRQQHLRLGDPQNSAELDTASMPVVVNLGYSVHGNEPSGANASMVVAYHLAAARDAATLDWLDHAVIVLDPSLNPDGLSRFAHWANGHRGQVPVADPNHREHREPWPNGRTNHYWFDLNRDWLLAQHPESHARLARFHAWRPNVLTDFHEMGTDSTYFFQPGVPSRRNPLTPERNVELTAKIAQYHSRSLDAIGSLYYSEESFDDFYYGKGSTYPDVHGSVGILFEQASSRGHRQESVNGVLTFPFTIRNQVRTSFSTLTGAVELRQELLDYQREFYRQSLQMAQQDDHAAYIFGDSLDPARTQLLVQMLLRHGIEVRGLAQSVEQAEQTFLPEHAFVVPLNQPQYRLIRTLFDRPLEYQDHTFYDVSAWSMQLAFDLPFAKLSAADLRSAATGEPLTRAPARAGSFTPNPNAVAYAFEWPGYWAPRALNRLHQLGVATRVATRPFSSQVGSTSKEFSRGTIVIALGIQSPERGLDAIPPQRRQEIEDLLALIAREDGLDIHALGTGLTPGGVDLGSPRIRPLERPRPALVVGEGFSTYEAGEIWHLLDRRFAIETTLLRSKDVGRVDLGRYTHLILVDGDPGRWPDATADKLGHWLNSGGILMTSKRSAKWAGNLWVHPRDEASAEKPDGEPKAGERLPYEGFEPNTAEQLIGGAIFVTELDLTHPLAYGYSDPNLPVFRNSRTFLTPQKNAYNTFGVYSSRPHMAGFVSAENVEKLADSPAFIADRVGRGTVVRMADNPNFRAFWHATHKVFLNSLFFGSIVDRTSEGRFRQE